MTWLLFKYCGAIRICITVIPPLPSLPPLLVTQQIHCPFQPKQSPGSKIRLFRLSTSAAMDIQCTSFGFLNIFDVVNVRWKPAKWGERPAFLSAHVDSYTLDNKDVYKASHSGNNDGDRQRQQSIARRQRLIIGRFRHDRYVSVMRREAVSLKRTVSVSNYFLFVVR